jgi:sodium-dependent dicarboxylate transporter 2/3/5
MVWMAVWWLTEAIPISATALLPLVVFPLFGAATMEKAAAPYADPLIFLFMGGFLIALSMQRWGLDRRIALNTLRLVGTRPTHMIAGVMLATAVLSAFVSNTATTAMMLPVALSVIHLVGGTSLEMEDEEQLKNPDVAERVGTNFALCMLLGLAYSASLGGLATIIGSPPNAFLVGFVRNTISEPYRMELTYARWLLIGLPLSIIFLPITWFLLTHVLYPVRIRHIPGGRNFIRAEIDKLGRADRGERLTVAVFLMTAGLWILRPLLVEWQWTIGARSWVPFGGLTDAGIAMTGGLLLFVLPVDFRQRRFVMDWQTTKGLPWDVLVLFGGGLSLASAVQQNGVAEFIGRQATHFAGLPPLVIVLIVTTTVIFLTELTSNTATTATLLPVLAALAPGLGVHPYLLIFPAAIAASCAFMMPVATPPNAIVFGSGKITIPQMIKAGFWLNLIGILLVTVLTFVLLGPVLGLALY